MPEKSAPPGENASGMPIAVSVSFRATPVSNLKRGMIRSPPPACVGDRIAASDAAVSPASNVSNVPASGTTTIIDAVSPTYAADAAA